MSNTFESLFPAALLEYSDNANAFVELFDYLFYNSTYVSGAIALPVAPGVNNPVLNEMDNVVLFTELKNDKLTEAMLDELAYQFNNSAYDFTLSLALKRALIKNTLELARYKGTPYAIEYVLTKFGYTNIVITENISLAITYDGTFTYRGIIDYSGTLENQLFSVQFESAIDLLTYSGDTLSNITSLVFNDGNYLLYNNSGKYYWKLYQVGAANDFFEIYSDNLMTDIIASGTAAAGVGTINFTNSTTGINGTVTFVYAADDTDSGNTINFLEEIRCLNLINNYKKYRCELYDMIIVEPSNPAGRSIRMFNI